MQVGMCFFSHNFNNNITHSEISPLIMCMDFVKVLNSYAVSLPVTSLTLKVTLSKYLT